jgi:type IV secretory pathway VirB2 component (pilin)
VARSAALCQCPALARAIPGDVMVLNTKLLRGGLAMAIAAMATAALAGVPADPAGSGVIVGAVNWLQGTLLGTVATVAAVIAVAAVGFMMLTGRINWRHGAVVILGCFILFGAASIVAGIRAAAAGG